MKGKVTDLENKVHNYQSRLKSFNQENEDLKASNAEMRKNKTQTQEENKQLKQYLGYTTNQFDLKYHAFVCVMRFCFIHFYL